MSKKPLRTCFKSCLLSPEFILLLTVATSAFALAAALLGQFAFGLAPCQMCIYQRIPFLIVVIGGIAAFALRASRRRAYDALLKPLLAVNAVAFAVNAALATYHTAIERGWIEETQGCVVDFNFSDPSLIDKIMSAQATSCTDIPWQDPLFGLSMANLNVLLCAALFAACVYGLLLKPKLQEAS